MESNRAVFIYGLNDPRTGKCRYVGKATDCKKRAKAHWDRRYASNSHKNCWIRQLASFGLKPVLEVLYKVPMPEWEFWEREYIRLFKAIGFDLTNALPGGEGLPTGNKVSEVTRAKMATAQRGRKHSEETKRKMSLAHSGERNPMFGRHDMTPAQKIARAARRGIPRKPFTAEHRRRISEKTRNRARVNGKFVVAAT